MKKVLSLFNGKSGARMSFDVASIDCKVYYSEVDKFANKLTQHLYPEDIPIGDVRKIDVSNLPVFDYVVGGSPCQSFSFSGKRNGMTTKDNEEILSLTQYLGLKGEGFEFTGQSYLFWEYIRVLREVQKVNPNVKFLLENVVMSKKWEKVISDEMGVEPVLINSSLVSAQNRRRLYWTNINSGVISQPKDQDIYLKDIIESGVGLITESRSHWLCSESGQQSLDKGFTHIRKHDDKSSCLTARMDASWNTTYVFDLAEGLESYHYVNCDKLIRSASIVGRRLNDKGKRDDYNSDLKITQCLEARDKTYNKSNCLTTVQKDNLLTWLDAGRYPDAYKLLEEGLHYRKLTVRECMRLQTVPDHIINLMLECDSKGKRLVSDSQLYKMCGNGWTIDVISHILKH